MSQIPPYRPRVKYINEKHLPGCERQEKDRSQILLLWQCQTFRFRQTETLCCLRIFLKISGLKIGGSCDQPFWFLKFLQIPMKLLAKLVVFLDLYLSRLSNVFVRNVFPLLNSFLLETTQAVLVCDHTLTNTCIHPSGGGGGRVCHSNTRKEEEEGASSQIKSNHKSS